MTFKNKRVLIPLPDSGFYSNDRRRRDVMELNIDIEDAILSVLKTLTEPTRSIDPFQNNQELLELAFDSFEDHRNNNRGIEFIKNVKTHDDLLVLEEILKHAKSCDDSLGYIKKRVAELLLLAESFLAPLMPKMRQVGLPITVENFRRHPSFASFDIAVMPGDNENLTEGFNLFFDELRKDNLRKLTVNTRDSSVSFKLPKPTPLPTDLNTIDAPGYFSVLPVTNVGTPLVPTTNMKAMFNAIDELRDAYKPLVPLPESKIDAILDSNGEGVIRETFDYSLDGFLAEIKSVLLFNRNDKEIEHIILVIRLLVGYYSKPPTDLEYHTLMNFLGVTDFVSLKDNLNNAYRWYSNVASTFADIEKSFPRTRVDGCIFHLQQMQCSLRALFLGLIWDLYGSLYRHSDPYEVFCKAVFDAEVDLNIEKHLGHLHVNFPALTVFTPQELDNPEQIAGRMYFTTRYDDIGNFRLSDGFIRDQPLYLSLNDGSWSSPHLFGINAQKKTGVVFTVYNPLVLLGQPDILEYRMHDPEFRREVSDKGHDAVIYTSMKDPSSNQMVILKPSDDTVKVIDVPQKLIDNYMEMRHNRFEHAVQFVQKSNLRINADMSINF